MPSPFKLQSDTSKLKQWLTKRKASLENARTPVEGKWHDLRLYYEPYLGTALLSETPSRDTGISDGKIINSEPRILLHRLAAGLQSGITSQAQQWFRLRAQDPDLNKYAAVRQWMDECTDIVSSLFARSNVYPALDQVYLHLGCFGTSSSIITPRAAEASMHMQVLDEGSYWIAQDRFGRVNTLLRRTEMTAASVAEEFGTGWTPEKLRQTLNEGRHEEPQIVWHLIFPNTGNLPDVPAGRSFASIYWIDANEEPNDGILAIRSFDYNPIVAPRWMVFNSAYGVGCGHIGLPDAKQLQAMEFDKLKVIEEEVDPPLMAPDTMKDEPIRTGPGGVTYYPAQIGLNNAAQRPGIGRLYDKQQKLEAILLGIDATEQRLARTFYSDLFALMISLNLKPKQMTAREVQELSAEKVALLGPILTRLNTDMLGPLVDAGFQIALQHGLIPDPPSSIQGAIMQIEYVSALHMERQAASRMGGIVRLAEFVGSMSPMVPTIVDKLNADKMVDVLAQSIPEHGVVRDQREVDEMRAERARMMQQEQEQQAAALYARAAKDLSQAEDIAPEEAFV